MTDAQLVQLLMDNNIYGKAAAIRFVDDLRRTANFSKAVRRVFDLKAILEIEDKIEKQFRKDGSPIRWPSLSTGIVKAEPEGQRDGKISQLRWPSLQPEKGDSTCES